MDFVCKSKTNYGHEMEVIDASSTYIIRNIRTVYRYKKAGSAHMLALSFNDGGMLVERQNATYSLTGMM